ncbi:hypothetical protein ANN_00169 [Periplaneta americana]|uniref:C2H2-type domain-containing protein n=1 Tax=Periplaneta americana TaxID=6978 RepID=A0ABQ8TR45_PERAM|nr:hypothetical protein ANN_00169 [Periplaneta americana]
MERCKEHQRSIRLYYPDKSAVAQHSLETGHKIDFSATTILDKTSGYWDLVIKEAMEIQLDGNNFNRDGGLQLSTAWKPAINTLRPPAHGRQSGPAKPCQRATTLQNCSDGVDYILPVYSQKRNLFYSDKVRHHFNQDETVGFVKIEVEDEITIEDHEIFPERSPSPDGIIPNSDTKSNCLDFGKKLYKCNICGRGFIQNNRLAVHRRSHTTKKRFLCDICGKLFAKKCYLVLHIRTHTRRKPFKCDDCGEEFTQQRFLVSHSCVDNGDNSLKFTLPVVLYGCETWTLTLREEQRLRVFENKVLRKIFGAKRDEVTGEWRKLHYAELHALYPSPDIIRNIKSRRLRWAGYVARMGESRNAYRVLVGRPEGKRPLGRPRRRWEDNIKMYLKEVGYDDGNWINLAQDRDQ